jgi:hypothetical protein
MARGSTATNAETVALQALAFIAGDEGILNAFMASSGCSLDELKGSAGDPAFLGGILDFLLQDDGNVLEFCRSAGLEPSDLFRARHALPGSPGFEF